MIARQSCILYTQDTDLIRMVSAYLRELVSLTTATTSAAFKTALEHSQPCMAIVDLRAAKSRDVLPQIKKGWPATLVIALGVPRSDPMHEAEMSGVYAAEDLQFERKSFQGLINRAVQHLELVRENSELRGQPGPMPTVVIPTGPATPAPQATTPTAPMRHLARTARRFTKLDALLQEYMEQAAELTGAARAGIFFRARGTNTFTLHADQRCGKVLRETTFIDDDSLPCWMSAHPQMITRITLEHTAGEHHQLLAQALDQFGADVILPIHGQEEMLGWVFIGPRFTGLPLHHNDLEQLAAFADHMTTGLDNALLYDEARVQKLHLETLLDSMATGILMTESNGTIRWLNAAARDMLDLPDEMGTGHGMEVLGSHVTDALQSALHGEELQQPTQWTDQHRKRTFIVRTRPLLVDGRCVGACALVREVSAEPQAEPADGVPDQASFWAELAASMSHEIRNPLVAIKTFAQLLPDRYDDKDFREQFSQQVVEEVDRLNGVVEQINAFAYPPELHFKSIDLRRTIRRGMNLALIGQPNQGITFEIAIDDRLPIIQGDEDALSECFTHLFLNAIEAVGQLAEPRIVLSAKTSRDANNRDGILVTVEDNGPGISDKVRKSIFSPFCTTKPRGLGLGLPVVKRTVFDHRGDLQVDSGETGTRISLMLPTASEEKSP